MKIKKIKWNGRVMDATHVGEKTGTRFVYDEAEVEKYNSSPNTVEKIIEETLTVYSIFYKSGKILRVFNPVEVLFDDND